MISVRKACQGLAEGDEPASAALGAPHYTVEGDVLSRGAARMNLEEMGKELGMEDGRIRANGGGGSCDVEKSERWNNVEERCGNEKEFRRGDGSARDGDGERGTEKGEEGEGAAEGRGVDEDGQEGGVPLSIACSENGKTVAVAVSG